MRWHLAVLAGVQFVSSVAAALIAAPGGPGPGWIAVPALFYALAEISRYPGDKTLRVEAIARFLMQQIGSTDDKRCTVHYPVKILGRVLRLRQAFDYVPTGGGGLRLHRPLKGIIALVLSEKIEKVENFKDPKEFMKVMQSKYGYTERDLHKLSADRRSYLCIPIKNDLTSEVLALLYLDSDVCGAFSADENADTRKLVRTAAQQMRNVLI
jgi:hypothetical protein